MSVRGFIDPTSGPVQGAIAFAPRASTLQGKVVGLLDNTKEQADIILKTIGDALVAQHGASRVVYRTKEMFSKPATAALLDEIAREADVAIAGLGG